MKTNFTEYLEKRKAQKLIDKIAHKYEGKKIVLYGAGFLASDLLRNYNFSALNILGVADMKFVDNFDGDFYGYKKLSPYDLLEMDFDLLLLCVYDDSPVKKFLRSDILQGEDENKCKVETLVKIGLWEYLKQVVKGEL